MDWADERYVRLYVRDSLTWELLGYDGQCVLALLLRKLNRRGVIEIGARDPAKAVAAILRGPVEAIARGLAPLLDEGVFKVENGCLVMPNFIAAQEARASNAKRCRTWRETKNDTGDVRDDTNDVDNDTQRHVATQSDTPSSAQHSLAKDEDKTAPLPDSTNGASKKSELRVVPTDGDGNEVRSKAKRQSTPPPYESWFYGALLPLYPKHRRVQIEMALAWLRKDKPDEARRTLIIVGLERWKASREWTKEGGEFVSGVGKFLNDTMFDKPCTAGVGRPQGRSETGAVY